MHRGSSNDAARPRAPIARWAFANSIWTVRKAAFVAPAARPGRPRDADFAERGIGQLLRRAGSVRLFGL
jgi:hypothetical protein